MQTNNRNFSAFERGKVMIPKNLLINKPASPAILEIAEKQFKSKDDVPLFAVIGDLDVDGKYGEGGVYVAKNRLVARSLTADS